MSNTIPAFSAAPASIRIDVGILQQMPNPIPSPTDQIATPEGDNEFAPNQPISPLEEQALETPPGSRPDSLQDPEEKQPESKPKGIEKFIDEVARGEFM